MNFSLPFFGFSVVTSAAALILCPLAWPGACAIKVNGPLMNREDQRHAGGNQREAGDIGAAERLAQVEPAEKQGEDHLELAEGTDQRDRSQREGGEPARRAARREHADPGGAAPAGKR